MAIKHFFSVPGPRKNSKGSKLNMQNARVAGWENGGGKSIQIFTKRRFRGGKVGAHFVLELSKRMNYALAKLSFIFNVSSGESACMRSCVRVHQLRIVDGLCWEFFRIYYLLLLVHWITEVTDERWLN